GTFTSTPNVSTLSVGSMTAFTVNSFGTSNMQTVPIAAQINITGAATDTGNLYDGGGINSLVASGTTATLKRNLGNSVPLQTVVITSFGKVTGFQTQGSNDTVHQAAVVDFVFQTVGNWTSV